MNRFWKRTLAAVLALGMAVSLTACGGGGLSSFDATKYVQGILDENYLGKFDDDFLEMVDSTASEAEEIYTHNLEVEADYFGQVFEIDDMSGDTLDATMELYRKIYANSKFTVDPATKVDDSTFSVKVTVEPIDVFHLVAEEFAKLDTDEELTSPAMKEFSEKYVDIDVTNMTDEQYETYLADFEVDWTKMMLALTEEKIPEAGHLEAKSILIQVAKDEDGIWGIPDDDFNNLDMMIIDYNFSIS